MLYGIKKENLIEAKWLQELSFGNSVKVKVKAVHCKPIHREQSTLASL